MNMISGRTLKALATYIKSSSKNGCRTNCIVFDNKGSEGSARLWCTDGHGAILCTPLLGIMGPEEPIVYAPETLYACKVRERVSLTEEGLKDSRGFLPKVDDIIPVEIDAVLPKISSAEAAAVHGFDPSLFERITKCIGSIAHGSGILASRFQFSSDPLLPCRIDHGDNITAVIMPCRLT